ncbi:MAG: WD40 repeat domain-containing protein, partial [Nannocystaceae bacterium]
MTLSTSTVGETETSEGELTETTAGPSGSETDPSTKGETETDSDTDPMTTEEPIISFEIMPDELTVVVYNNISEQGDYNALYDGQPVEPTWALNSGALAVIDDEGKVLGTGSLGGQTIVQASYEGELDEALLNVVLEKNVDIGPIEPIDKDLLEGATEPDGQITWAYPYDRMVYPLGLRAPELMWNGGGAGDKYLIHLTGDFIDFKYFMVADPPSRFLMDSEDWEQISKTLAGKQINLKVSRLPAGAMAATVVVEHTWTIANGALDGSVYYWANSLGRVLRINPGADAPEDFLSAGGQDGCSTCHSVSSDGNTLILGGDIKVSTWDLVNNESVLNIEDVGKPVRNWAMPAISPNGEVVIENAAPLPGPPGGSDGMWNALTGEKLVETGLEGVQLDMPAFAPDGSIIAYVDHETHALATYDYDAQNVSASNPVALVEAGEDPAWNGITFPSVSPDGKWIVYHRGNYPNSLDTRLSPGDLFIASVDTPGLEYRLGEVNGDDYPFAAGDR